LPARRLFVERSIYKSFVERLVQATKNLVLGDPFDERTQVAPLVHFDHRDARGRPGRRAVQAGAEVLCGGAIPQGADYDRGAFYLPTILAGLSNDAAICREEVFGPVLCVLPFDDEADVIAQSNASDYGLACGVWTRDFPKAWRMRAR
jgi:betaine-aldehyde dehydrogenase